MNQFKLLFALIVLSVNISLAQEETRLHKLFFDFTISPTGYFPKNEKALFAEPIGITFNYLMANFIDIRFGYQYDLKSYASTVINYNINNNNASINQYKIHYQRFPVSFNFYWKRNDTLDIYSVTGFIFGPGSKYSTFGGTTLQLGLGSHLRINKHFCWVIEFLALNYICPADELYNNPSGYSTYNNPPPPTMGAPGNIPMPTSTNSYPSFSRWGLGIGTGVSFNPW